MTWKDDSLCDIYVQEAEKKRVLEILNNMSFAEAKKKLGIYDDYYLKKLLSGQLPISGYVYFCVVPELVHGPQTHYCIHCERIIVARRALYCAECNENRFLGQRMAAELMSLSCILSSTNKKGR